MRPCSLSFGAEAGLPNPPKTEALAARLRNESVALARQMCSRLPKNRELIRKISDYGLKTI